LNFLNIEPVSKKLLLSLAAPVAFAGSSKVQAAPKLILISS
jgi:hypothetical protein